MEKQTFIDPSLIAPCGMNCGLCLAFLREKNKCPGCRIPDDKKPVTRKRCKIKNCPKLKESRSGLCGECTPFPCASLKHLDLRYQTKYKMSQIDNIKQINALCMSEFLKNEKEKWTCKKCGGPVCVHKGFCLNCNP